MKQRMLSLLLCCAIFCSAFSGTALTGKAKEKSQGDSIYDSHVHMDECYRVETSCVYSGGDEEGVPSEVEEGHVCSEESGCIKKVLDCPYAKDEQSGDTSEPEDAEGFEPKQEEESGDTNAEQPEEKEEQNPQDPNEGNPEDIKDQEQESNKKPEDEKEEEEKAPVVVSSWEWVDEEGMLVWSEELGKWGLGLPGASEENKVTTELLAEMLPASITASLAEGQTEVLTLDWDFSVLPEGGVFEGTHVLIASLPAGYVLGDGAGKLSVRLEVGGGELYVTKYLNQWSFVPRMGTITEENNIFTLEFFMAGGQDRETVEKTVINALPTQIRCWTSFDGTGNVTDNMKLAGFVYDEPGAGVDADGKTYGNVAWGWANIDWRASEISQTSFEFEKKYTFHADVKANVGHDIYVNSNVDSKSNTLTNPDLLSIDVILHELHLESHTVPGINPPNTTVNLFDYWVDTDGSTGNDLLETQDIHDGEMNPDVERTGVDDWNKGINVGRLLLFGDGNIHAGFWNKGAGAGSEYGQKDSGMMGIVEPVLQNGYPAINTNEMEKEISNYTGISDWKLCGDHIGDISDERYDSINPKNISNTVINNWKQSGNTASLDYLFNPEISSSYKRAYQDVKGLFQIDSNGYYYYDMRQNFAEFDKGSNRFTLYDAPAVERTDGNSDGSRSTGNFFPFNTGAQVFDLVKNGKLDGNENISSHNRRTTAGYMNHHLGMTVNIDFRQPLGGSLSTGSNSNTPMTFQFSGDDDVWIYIDDVLVLDLGGIHSEIYGTIDFSTGEVLVGQSWKTNGFPYKPDGTVDLEKLRADAPPTEVTTLKAQFEKAGKEDVTLWNGNTFASNTGHTLKMFYLERGNYDSSLALRFNLQPLLYQQIKKVDQNGSPLAGVEFDLCPAEETTAGTPGAIECFYTDTTVNSNQVFYVKQAEGSSFVHLTTASDGTARFLDSEGNYFNFADRGNRCYILKETKTPNGYRTLPEDIVLYYDPSTSMLSVANRWNTGAYACSMVHVTGTGSLNYGVVNTTEGKVEQARGLTVSREKQNNGLVVAIPMLLQKSSHTWETLYGSNISGFSAFRIGKQAGAKAWETAALRAALEQAAGSKLPGWNLSWDSENLRLTGVLSDLPGLANRYTLINPDGSFYQWEGDEEVRRSGYGSRP
ncbi:MAG: fibro-slime domain-containing protein [Lachnospiraceae bacterium]|jgi:fibro-slime domain-containing protein|nr:fibro-slime domain-containing protein [Lachnospiraceae bacterium]